MDLQTFYPKKRITELIIRFSTGAFPLANLSSVADRSDWIMKQLTSVISLHLDGINLDIEQPIDPSQAHLLTTLVDETTKVFHLSIPSSQVSNILNSRDNTVTLNRAWNRSASFRLILTWYGHISIAAA